MITVIIKRVVLWGICLSILGAFAILEFNHSDIALWFDAARWLAGAIIFLTLLTLVVGKRGEMLRKIRLLVGGVALSTYVFINSEVAAQVVSSMLENPNREISLEELSPELSMLAVKYIVGMVGCLITIWMTPRIARVLNSFLRGAFTMLLFIPLGLGVLAGGVLLAVAVCFAHSFVILAGILIWLHTFYVLHLRIFRYVQVEDVVPVLTLQGDRGSLVISPKEVSYGVSSAAYRSLCADVEGISGKLFDIDGEGRADDWTWFLVPARVAGYKLLLDNAGVSHKVVLTHGACISLSKNVYVGRTWPEHRQVTAISLWGDLDHVELIPSDSPYQPSSGTYSRLCSDAPALPAVPYRITTWDKGDGSCWYIEPVCCCAEEPKLLTLVDGERLSEKQVLKAGQWIELCREGEEDAPFARVQVKCRSLTETQHTDDEQRRSRVDTEICGRVRVSISEKRTTRRERVEVR